MAQTAVLRRGSNVTLTGVGTLNLGLSWETPDDRRVPYDLDASAFVVGANGKVLSDEHFVFFNNLISPCGKVSLSGDSLDGNGPGDDEIVTVRLSELDKQVQKVVIVVSIYKGRQRGQCFGDLDNAAIRLVSSAHDDAEIATFNITQGDLATETAMIFGELYRYNGEWKFRAVAQGFAEGFAKLAREFGVDLADEPDTEEELPAAASQVLWTPSQQPVGVDQHPLFVPGAARAAALSFDSGGCLSAGGGSTPPVLPHMQIVHENSLLRGRWQVEHGTPSPMRVGNGDMTFTLAWENPRKDLGLILLVTYRDGSQVAYDWRNLGSPGSEVYHHGDSRSAGREFVTIRRNPDSYIDSVAVVAYSEQSNGLGSFHGMRAHAIIENGLGDTAVIRLKKRNPFAFHVVIAVVVFGAPGQMFVQAPERYSGFGSERRPQLHRGGFIVMNTGEVVRKPGRNPFSWY